MSSAPTVTPHLPRPLWIDASSMRLGELLPALAPIEADAFASDTFDEAADLEPAEAAEIFANELPPGDPGAP